MQSDPFETVFRVLKTKIRPQIMLSYISIETDKCAFVELQ